jgi:hypothetical protein
MGMKREANIPGAKNLGSRASRLPHGLIVDEDYALGLLKAVDWGCGRLIASA